MFIGDQSMKDILEYSKQAANDYPFVYQDTIEADFRDGFNKVLVEHESKLLEKISNYGPDYNILKKDLRYRRPINYERFYDFDYTKLSSFLFSSYSYAYSVGGQQAYKDFNQDKIFKLDALNAIEISKNSNLGVSRIYESYKNLILSKLKVGFNKDYSFGQFFDDLSGYSDFSKSDISYTSPMPSKENFIDNYATREVTRNVNEGRLSGYNRTRRVLKYIYKTRADERVSSICAPWHNRILNPDEVKNKLPQHRNCRCTIVPYI